jgi:ABC-type transporter Mla MlaB component
VLKIDIESQGSEAARVRLSGRLSSDHLPELARLVDCAFESGRQIRFDLDGVTLADRAAVAFLARGASRGISIERCPAFLREWIRGEAAVTAPFPQMRGYESRENALERQGERS